MKYCGDRMWPSGPESAPVSGQQLKHLCYAVLAVVSLGWTLTSVSAQQRLPQASDFAYGYMLAVDGDGAIYGLSLPEDVYRNVTRADLGDMRVFNSGGRIVPMAVRRQPASVGVPHAVSLPLFPLYGQDGQTATAMALHITTDMQGVIVDIKGQPRDDAASVEAYLLDASQLKQAVQRLRLHWSGAPASFVTAVSVEGSDDLTHWHTVINKVTLVSLKFNNRQLRRDEIILPPTTAKYLRVRWPAGRKGAVLDAVEADVSEQARTVPRQWLRISGKPHGQAGAEYDSDYYFNSEGIFPVDRVQIVLPPRNALVRVSLASRASADQAWQIRFRGVVYHFLVDGAALSNEAVRIAPVTDKLWRVRLASPAGWSRREVPVLLLGWRPDQLLFVASGKAPFRLAYGSAGVTGDKGEARALLRTLAKDHNDDIIKAAQPGSRIELGGAARLRMPGPPLPWRQWLLWGILIFGTVGLGWMAWRLYRQMGRPED